MRFLLEQKEALEICCQPTSPQKHSKVTYSRGEREWKISRAPNVAAGNDLKKIHKMSRPVMWGVREAAGRFKREGLRAAERCQQSVKENVGELSGCVCEEKACHTDKKNSWRKTKSQSLWNRNRYANSLNAIERMNEWFFFCLLPYFPCFLKWTFPLESPGVLCCCLLLQLIFGFFVVSSTENRSLWKLLFTC